VEVARRAAVLAKDPVVLKPTAGRIVDGKLSFAPRPSLLLGVLAETRYASVRAAAADIPSFAGLGLAFDVETISETIEQFF
jgi:hypothetical protein